VPLQRYFVKGKQGRNAGCRLPAPHYFAARPGTGETKNLPAEFSLLTATIGPLYIIRT